MGMDVAQSLLDMGREMNGRQFLEFRKVTLHVIDEQGMVRGIAFNADVVLSFGVACHDHPDELATYFRNLSRLAHKDGAFIILTTTIGAGRSANMTWARPIDCHVEGLPGHDLVKVTNMYDPIAKRGVTCTRARLVFPGR
jgi:cyclopropane fatty-acyl-phospholipid synthase-like methyltransferase